MVRSTSRRLSNVSLRVDTDVLTWARTRALFARTSVNELLRQFLTEYAAVPEGWPGVQDPRPAYQLFAEVMETLGAGGRAREAQESAMGERRPRGADPPPPPSG